jgi:hypothetical protein
MVISDGDPVRSSEPRAEVPRLEAEKSQEEEVARLPRRSMAWAWAATLAAGLATGFVAWALGEWALTTFSTRYQLTPEQRKNVLLQSAEIARQRRASEGYVAMFTYGSLGAALGLSLGLAGGLARRSLSRGLAAALTGLILGGGAAAAAVWAILPFYVRTFQASADNLSHDLVFPLIVHGAMWTCAGAVGGGALGLGLGNWARAMRGAIGGALGAFVGTVIYEFLGAVLFPLAETTKPISDAPGARMLALLNVAVLASLGALWATSTTIPVPSPSTENR